MASSSQKKQMVYRELRTDYCSEFNDGAELVSIKLRGANDKASYAHNVDNTHNANKT